MCIPCWMKKVQQEAINRLKRPVYSPSVEKPKEEVPKKLTFNRFLPKTNNKNGS